MRLRPTRHAIVFFFILGAMFLASINYQSNAAWLMVFLVACSGAVSAVHGWRNAAPAGIVPGDAPMVAAGECARISLTVSNRSAHELLALVIEAKPVQIPGEAPPPVRRLLVSQVPAGGMRRTGLLLPPFPRGVHRIDAFRISTQYPLGLFRITHRIPVRLAVHVYPAPEGVPLERMPVDQDAASLRDAGLSDHAHGDFRGLRIWRSGESVRHVDWKAAARSFGPLQVKDYGGGGRITAWLSWTAAAGDAEARLSQLARWVIEAHLAGLRYGLRLPGREIGPADGSDHRRECLHALSTYLPPGGPSAFRPSVMDGRLLVPRG